MRVTQYNEKTNTVKQVELVGLMESMRSEQRLVPVRAFREELVDCGREYSPVSKQKLPILLFGARFARRAGVAVMDAGTGIVLLEFNDLPDRGAAERLRAEAAGVLQTLAAFVGAGGKSLKVLVRFVLPDGSVPVARERAEWFQAHAYRRAAAFYEAQLQQVLTRREPVMERGCRFTLDAGLYFNPEALPIRMEQPLSLPQAVPAAVAVVAGAGAALLPGYEQCHLVSQLFNAALGKTLQEVSRPRGAEDDARPFLVCLAEHCRRGGVAEEDAVRYTLLHTDLRPFELELRDTMRHTYSLGGQSGKPGGLLPAQQLICRSLEFMQRRYEFRRNELRGDVEYRERCSFSFHFAPVSEAVLNTIGMQAQAEGLDLWDRDVKRYVYSASVPVYHPLEDYLCKLPAWDGTDRIRPLADTLPTSTAGWRDRFYTWFLGLVAQWKGGNRLHGNSVAPLLVGAQGSGKSTWCLRLLPPELRAYYADRLDLGNKREAELALTRFALINLDEFDSISNTQQAFLKHLMQKPVVNIRPPHGGSFITRRRYGSFMATSNNFDLLSDPTGSRRYLCVEIVGRIALTQPVCYEQLYAQALSALSAGERHWFSPEEEAEMVRSNNQFCQLPLEEQLFHTCFRQPKEGEAGEWLTATAILLRVQERTSVRLGHRRMTVFARHLLKNNFVRKHTNRGNLWHVFSLE